MASKPVMLLGNLTSMLMAIAGILQVVSWTIVGATILAVLSITTLAPARSPPSETESSRPSSKKTGHSQPESKAREKIHEKPTDGPHQAVSRPGQRQPGKDEQRSPLSKSDFQKPMAPKIALPKTVPTNISSPAKATTVKSVGQRPGVIVPIPVGPAGQPPAIVKSAPVKLDPNSRIIPMGDYATFDVELGPRIEVTCEVTANAPVNVYLMDEDNLNSLDLGEEFWSETGEECVQKATLRFVAPQSGKWVLVVENSDNKEVTATAVIRKAPAQNQAANGL